MTTPDISEPGKTEHPLPRAVAEFSRENHLLGFSLSGHLLKTAVVCILLLAGNPHGGEQLKDLLELFLRVHIQQE